MTTEDLAEQNRNLLERERQVGEANFGRPASRSRSPSPNLNILAETGFEAAGLVVRKNEAQEANREFSDGAANKLTTRVVREPNPP